ncbi:hypothetical protein ABZ791_17730 [Streptomyces huasconensis]|uniref:Uncharacterized protein n=1 Tax=Streptomyces huasconensis TaxID=1854574 RepID=A0ABV3LME4_9ACTN
MSVDPTDPETFEPDEDVSTAEPDVEAPEADAAEQQADLTPSRDDSLRDADPNAASEADLAEQARVVDLDEDDYR